MLSSVDKHYFKLAVGSHNIGKDTLVDVSARCPVCGDSKKNKNLKRLHLYEKNGTTLVNCFNCDVHYNVYNFLKVYKPELLEQYKRETFTNNINSMKDDLSGIVIEKKEEVQDILHHDLTSMFTPLDESEQCIKYLNSRGISYTGEFGKWYTAKGNIKIGDVFYNIQDSIIIPLYYKDVMYGFYSRKITEKYFCTYNPSHNLGFKIWNWFGIDKEEPCFIFEGIFDAISSGKKNIIATMGAKLPDGRVQELKEPVFCLDNDKTGISNSISYTNKGYKSFIYPDNYLEKDMNELAQNHPFDIEQIIDNNIYQGISASVRLKAKL